MSVLLWSANKTIKALAFIIFINKKDVQRDELFTEITMIVTVHC